MIKMHLLYYFVFFIVQYSASTLDTTFFTTTGPTTQSTTLSTTTRGTTQILPWNYCPAPYTGYCSPCKSYPQCFWQAPNLYSRQAFLIIVNASVFPTIPAIALPDIYTLNGIIIEGDFQYVPEHPFRYFQLMYPQDSFRLILARQSFTTMPLKVFPGALNFNGVSDYPVKITVEFTNFFLPTIPTEAFTNQLQPIDTLVVRSSSMEYLIDYSFVYATCNGSNIGVNVQHIDLSNNQIKSIELNAFYMCNSVVSFNVSNNMLTDVSPAFKTATFSEVYLENNKISSLQDYAFCGCNFDGGCPNANLNTLDLSNNPLKTISTKAFSNLSNLRTLYMRNVSMASVSLPSPMSVLQPLKPTLQTLDLSNNQIDYLETYSFSQYSSMSSLVLDNNPIVGMAAGAFINNSIRELSFKHLPLMGYIDLLVTYQMPYINSLTVTNCNSLTNVILNDASKLPPTLTYIGLQYNNLRSIDAQVQYFLQRSVNNYIDLNQNANFNCNPSIAWMKPFVPSQIKNTDFVKCGYGQTLTVYLNSLN